MKTNRFFEQAKSRAQKTLQDPDKVTQLISLVRSKLGTANLEFSKMADKIRIMTRMVKAYLAGNYKIVPWKSIIVITAVLIYFIMPVDLLPDFIPVTGYIDDFSLIMWVYGHLKDDISTFVWWEQYGKNA